MKNPPIKNNPDNTDASISTEEKPRKAWHFQPGNNANPMGRPKGSRNKLGEAFVAAMYDDFTEHGQAAIETVRRDKPDQYLKVIASILPKELHIKDATLEDMSDEELIEMLAAIRAMTKKDMGERRLRKPVVNPQLAKPPKTVN